MHTCTEMDDRQQPRQVVADFVQWVGLGRIVTTFGGVVIVLTGAWWVLQTPPPPIESRIPVATAAVSTIPDGAPSPKQSLTTPSIPLTIVVHVAGEVVHPGVVVVAGGSRIIDALGAAGGPTSLADLNVVNLAATLVDAAQIYIPKRGEITKRPATRPSPGINLPTASIDRPISDRSITEQVDLNSATEQQLDTLPGVGPSTARAIVDYRVQHGPFARVEDLLNVRGIGPAKLEVLLGLVRV
ncbi:MAG: helix-hairpin-helix domain-containing protein [Actinomycetota bacterium]